MKKIIKFFIFHLQRQVKIYSLRNIIAHIQSIFRKKHVIDGASDLFNINNELEKSRELIKNGYTELGLIDNTDVIDKIIAKSNKLKVFNPFAEEKVKYNLNDIPVDARQAMFSRNDLVQIDEVLQIANDPSILRIVEGFLLTTPTISNINMWWSIPREGKAQNAQLFHRDVDDIKFCKLFIYLTDVGENDGPHTFVRGSTSSNKLTYIKRYSDDEIIESFGKQNIITFQRPKYSCFLVNTYGFHKGTPPLDSNRLLLQVQYSINPIGIENYTPVKLKHNYNRFINRLILK